MKIFSYLRVSSKGQLDGDGFDRQRDSIDRFCKSKGYEVLREFSEPISGTVDGLDRPVYAEMLSLCGPATTMIIVVENADRLARDLMVSELLLDEARKDGVQVWAANSEQELATANNDPTRVLIRQLLGALAQWDKSNMVRRLRAARERKRKDEGRCEGMVAYEEVHTKIAEKIYACWKATEWSFSEMVEWVNMNRFPSPSGKKYWTKGTLWTVLRRMDIKKNQPKPFKKVDERPVRDDSILL